MKILLIIACFLISFTAFADLGTTIYSASGSGKLTASACVFVNFTLIGFTGSIGNASFSNASVSIPVQSAFQSGSGQRLNAIPYTVSSGTLIVTEVK